MKKYLLRLIAASLLAGSALHANAALLTTAFGNQVPGYVQNDDMTFGAFNLGFSLNLFGHDYSSFYISNNGLLSFGHGYSSYSPLPLDQATGAVIVAPYWTDLSTSNSRDKKAGVYLIQTANQTVVTWNDMGYFSNNYSGTVTFQAVLNSNGKIGFYYGNMSAGNDQHAANAGFGDSLITVNPGEISSANGPTTEIAAQLNQSQYLFALSDKGIPTTVPEPASIALMGIGMLGFALKLKHGGRAGRDRARG